MRDNRYDDVQTRSFEDTTPTPDPQPSTPTPTPAPGPTPTPDPQNPSVTASER